MEIMDLSVLTKFGMTPIEAKVYAEITKNEENRIGLIIKKTNLHRGTVYNSIHNLIEKGFVLIVNKSGISHYKSTGKKIFEILSNQQKEDSDKNIKELDSLFTNIYNLKKEGKQEVDLIYGLNGFKKVYLEMYDECKEKNQEYLFMGEGGKMTLAVGEGYYKFTQKLKNKMKLNCRIILSKETKNLPYRKYTEGNIKYLPTKVSSPVNFWIYSNKVIIALWDSSPLICIKIIGEDTANGFRNYFEYLWKIAKK
jgi:predicted transcriptional regulator